MGKFAQGLNIANKIHEIAKDPNPANRAGAAVTAAVGAAGHPYIAPLAGAAAKKVVEFGMRPDVQAKAKEIGKNVADGAASAAGAAARNVRRGVGTGLKKIQAFREGHGK